MCLDCACGLPGDHVHDHAHEHPHTHEQGMGSRHLSLSEQLLSHNDDLAAANRRHFADAGVAVINLLSSPGSGKTALLERMARDWRPHLSMAVVVGDLATDNDARRLQAAGMAAVQITTGQACHLEAAMVQRALPTLAAQGIRLDAIDLLVIENVGNLVCPAAYDLGESRRLVMLSVTEGEDKPLKYPAMFHSADLVVIAKIDLAEAVEFDRSLAWRNIERVAPKARIVEVSARNGAGMDTLLAELRQLSGLTPGNYGSKEPLPAGKTRSQDFLRKH